MTTAIILIVLLGSGLFWAYRVGRKTKDAERLHNTKRAIGSINEYDRKVDEETQRQVDNAGDNPVRGPWLRVRRWF